MTRRKLVVISVLIEHPTEGLILFETGAGKDYPEVWGAPLNDIFAQVDYDEDQEIENQIKKTGHDIKDVKAVIVSKLLGIKPSETLLIIPNNFRWAICISIMPVG